MTKTRKNSKKKNKGDNQNKKYFWIKLLLPIGAMIIIYWIQYSKGTTKPEPTFGIKNPNQNAEIPIVIIAKNPSAERKDELDVCWDGFGLDKAAIPAPGSDVYEWIFTVSKEERLPDEYKIDGEHKLQFRFEGSFSEPLKIFLSSKQSEKTNNPENEMLQASFSLTLSEKIIFKPVPTFLNPPRSFCVTEDRLFLIPDIQSNEIAIFEKKDNHLMFKDAFPIEKKAEPIYCYYSRDGQNKGKLGIIDKRLKKIFIFNKKGKFNFSLSKIFNCENLGYDIKFTADGEKLIVSGFLADKDKKPFDLYKINIKSGQIDYLLPSPKKYGIKTYEKYDEEYNKKQTLPAIGIKGFFDIQGDDLFFVWEGALKIIKLNLRSTNSMDFVEHETPPYNKPYGSQLNDSYIIKDYFSTWKDQEMFSYIRNIFVTSQHIFLIYETAKNEISNGSRFRLQMYDLNGQFLGDVSIPGTSTTTPSQPMWLDKENHELYAFSKEANSDTGSFTILKYKIKF